MSVWGGFGHEMANFVWFFLKVSGVFWVKMIDVLFKVADVESFKIDLKKWLNEREKKISDFFQNHS